MNFIYKFKENTGEQQILDRTRQRLHHLKHQIYTFLLSPKDAFYQYNEDRSGKMTFDHFHNLVKCLAVMAGEQMPTFIIVKDLFNYIDTKRDGYIDLHEWMETFKRIEIPATSTHLQKVVLNPHGRAISVFERTKQFDNIVKIIAKNRRFLLQQFNELYHRRVPLNFETAKGVLDNLLGINGVKLDSKFWPLLIGFAEKDGRVDYKYLLDRYKERTSKVNLHPNPIVKNNNYM